MQIYLCEDIKEQALEFGAMLEECAKECNIQTEIRSFFNAEELLKDLRMKKETGKMLPDLLFSDIEMPGINGVEFGKILKEEMPEICFVFLTAYAEYAIEGYETGAYRYLLKPPAKEELTKILLAVAEREKKEKHIIVKNAGEEICLRIQDILYISAEDKYLVIHTRDRKILNRGSLQDYENRLTEFGFFRAHRKILVNLRYHKSIANGRIVLSNNEVLPLSRRCEKAYHKAFMNYLEGGLLQ